MTKAGADEASAFFQNERGRLCCVIQDDKLMKEARSIDLLTYLQTYGLKGNNIESWVMLSSEAKHTIDEAKACQMVSQRFCKRKTSDFSEASSG